MSRHPIIHPAGVAMHYVAEAAEQLEHRTGARAAQGEMPTVDAGIAGWVAGRIPAAYIVHSHETGCRCGRSFA